MLEKVEIVDRIEVIESGAVQVAGALTASTPIYTFLPSQ